MTLKDFAEKHKLSAMQEIEKVARCFYFSSRTQGLKSFSIVDVEQWFDNLDFARPNSSRLKGKLSASRDFIRAEGRNIYKLHSKKLRELEEEFKDETFDQQELPKSNSTSYVSLSRIAELEALENSKNR